MTLETLTSKYIVSAESVLGEIQQTTDSLTVDKHHVEKVIEWARAYLEDAKYYKAQKRLETSLASVTSCEGLLDALRLLGAVKFEWPPNPVNEH